MNKDIHSRIFENYLLKSDALIESCIHFETFFELKYIWIQRKYYFLGKISGLFQLETTLA